MFSIRFSMISASAALLAMFAAPQSQAAMTTAISAGNFTNCAVTTAGAAKCWGHNYYGQLGNGNSVGSTTPGIVSGLSTGVIQLTASHYNYSSCALLNDGSAKCWGDNSYGKLGSGDAVNKFIPT